MVYRKMTNLIACLFFAACVGDVPGDGNCQTPLEQVPRYRRVVRETENFYPITLDGVIHRNFIHRRVYRTLQRINQQLINELNGEQRKKFESLTGRWMRLERGNLEFHITFVERPAEIWGLNQQRIWMKDIEVDPRKVRSD